MLRNHLSLLRLRLALAGTVLLIATAVPQVLWSQSPATPSEDRLAWFRHDKFGMFIHFGPYSALGGEWKGRKVPVGENAEWIMHDMKIPAAEYRERAHQFNPTQFDANAIAHLAKQAGMKYLVLTAKHHDGFAMYKSEVSPYNIVDWTPLKRDLVKEMAEACKHEGIRFCVYYSHREDWDDPDAYGNDWDFNDASKNFERYLDRKSKPQLKELLTRYGPMGLVWFDRGIYTPAQAQSFVDLVHSLQPQCLVNGRVGNYELELMGDYQNMSDNGMPPGGLNEYWETPQTLNGTWGYSQFDQEWKSPQVVIQKLVEIVSKGGNYLLNIGPKGDGSLPGPTEETLQGVGKWMQTNSQSIYGTTASPFLNMDWGRCTVKGDLLYLHVFHWPKEGVLKVPGIKNQPRTASILGQPGQTLMVRRKDEDILVQLPPGGAPDPIDTVIELKLQGRPIVPPPVVLTEAGKPVQLDYLTALTVGNMVKRFNRGGGFHLSKWMAPADGAVWRLNITKPGRYQVRLKSAALPEWAGGKFVVGVGGKDFSATVEASPQPYAYQSHDLGIAELSKPGEYRVYIHPSETLTHDLMYLESIELIPVS